MMCVSALASCGKSQVHYRENGKITKESGQQGEKNTTETKEQWKTPGNGLDSGLARTLGLTQSTWKEDVESRGAEQYVDVKITIPDVSMLSTMTVREWYMTRQDKRKLCNAVFDEGTVEVDTSCETSREKLRYEMNNLEKLIKEAQEDSVQEEQFFKTLYTKCSRQYKTAKKMSALSVDPGEYTADAYIGKVNGVYMTLRIWQNSRTKSNMWRLEPLDYTGYLQHKPKQSAKFLKEHEVQINGRTLSKMGFCVAADSGETGQGSDIDNQCSFGGAQAAVRAREYCEKLGIPGMQVVSVQNGVIGVEDFTQEEEQYQETNGYQVRLRRQIGEAAGADVEYSNKYEPDYKQSMEYPAEEITMFINDSGVLNLYCDGMMKEEKTESLSSILKFEQIQQVVRRELGKMKQDRSEQRNWRAMYLEMIRMKNQNKPGEYRYIPAWFLCREEDTLNMDRERQREDFDVLCINAIDGTVINIEKECGFDRYDMRFSIDWMAVDKLRTQNNAS